MRARGPVLASTLHPPRNASTPADSNLATSFSRNNARFCDDDDSIRCPAGESLADLEIDLEGAEIAIVDTDEVRTTLDRNVEFAIVVNFDQCVEPEVVGSIPEPSESRLPNRCREMPQRSGGPRPRLRRAPRRSGRRPPRNPCAAGVTGPARRTISRVPSSPPK